MKFGAAKRTTPVVWTEIQFKFWHWVSTLQATTPQPGPLFIPKQDRRTSFMIPNHLGVWKVYLVKVDFPPFWHPFCWFLRREMGQNGVSGQVLLRFAPFLLQLYFLCNLDDSYKNGTSQVIGWWDMREWWWKIGFTLRAIRPIRLRRNWQHLCSGAISSYLWVLSLIVASPGHHTQFTFQKHPCLGPQMTTFGNLPQ